MKKAFTLVELMVVITVLGILSTIGFVSYVGYAQDSRDGVRVANLNDIKKGLELKKSQTGDFPIPDNAYSVQYLGKEIWKQ
jgi:prepilin-type N-terminal cleavage/methylation domain-containing protein